MRPSKQRKILGFWESSASFCSEPSCKDFGDSILTGFLDERLFNLTWHRHLVSRRASIHPIQPAMERNLSTKSFIANKCTLCFYVNFEVITDHLLQGCDVSLRSTVALLNEFYPDEKCIPFYSFSCRFSSKLESDFIIPC